MYQVEAICDRVLWIDQGQVMLDDEPPVVISAYSEFLSKQAKPPSPENQTADWKQEQKLARLLDVQVAAGGGPALKRVTAKSGESDLTIRVRFQSSQEVPIPSLGVVLVAGNGWAIASASSRDDGLVFKRTSDEQYEACITFSQLALLKGNYWVNVFLLCEKGLHLYDRAERVAEIEVRQECRELGVVSLPRIWRDLSD